MSLYDILDIAATIDPHRVISQDELGDLTLGRLLTRAAAIAAQLTSVANDAGSVAFVGVNSSAALLSLWAAVIAGRAFVPLNYRADRNLFEHMLKTATPTVAIADPRYGELLKQASGGRLPVIPSDSLATAEGGRINRVESSDDVAILLFTSGSSERPKAVRLRHRHLASYILGSADPLSEAPDSATLVASPTYHVASVANLVSSTYLGRRMVFMQTFDAAEWLRVAEAEGVTHAFVVPTMLHRIVEKLRAGSPPPSRLKLLAYGGAPAHPTLILDAIRLFAPATGFVNAYGLTETSSTISLLGPEDHRLAFEASDPAIRQRINSVGRPLPGIEIQIDGDTGEVLVRGAQVSGEYVTGASVGANEWFHTGDAGRLDFAGYLYLEGRIDDMIIRGGENISPLEIENTLISHTAVADATVAGLPDYEWGQRVVALVETSEPVTEAELITWLRERLPGFKVPERIVFVDSLPRTQTGKIARSSVREVVAKLTRFDEPQRGADR